MRNTTPFLWAKGNHSGHPFSVPFQAVDMTQRPLSSGTCRRRWTRVREECRRTWGASHPHGICRNNSRQCSCLLCENRKEHPPLEYEWIYGRLLRHTREVVPCKVEVPCSRLSFSFETLVAVSATGASLVSCKNSPILAFSMSSEYLFLGCLSLSAMTNTLALRLVVFAMWWNCVVCQQNSLVGMRLSNGVRSLAGCCASASVTRYRGHLHRYLGHC